MKFLYLQQLNKIILPHALIALYLTNELIYETAFTDIVVLKLHIHLAQTQWSAPDY